jgi:ABC-type transport system involved in multi-copper enzyme maturation permease subunit
MNSSFVRISAAATVEQTAIVRSHSYRLFVPTAALFVVVTPELVLFAFRERTAMIAQVGVSTAALFATALAILAGASSVARERESGIRDLLLARPLSAGEYLLGKWIGISAVVLFSVTFLGAIHITGIALRGGQPRGYGPLVAALATAAAQGALAGAVALAFSSFLRAGQAIVAAVGFFLLGYLSALLPDDIAGVAVRFLLPRTPELNLAGEAAFGPFSHTLWSIAVLHALLYSTCLLSIATPIAARRRAP